MNTVDLTLVEPSLALRDDFYAMLAEYDAAGEEYRDYDPARKDYGAYLKIMENFAQGIDLKEGYVPSSTYWLVRNGQTILAESHLRHFLNPFLEQFGGHIGYRVRPSERRKGYGTTLLAFTLQKAKELKLERVLLTCDDHNIGSYRIMEANGAILEGKTVPEAYGHLIRRYWITL